MLKDKNKQKKRRSVASSVSSKRLFRMNDPAMEEIRMIRTGIEFLDLSKNKMLLFTSALPGEGKSTIVSNLARSFAGTQKRVLVVDLDLRHPIQHSVWGKRSKIGFTQMVMRDYPVDDIIIKIEENLYFMPTGVCEGNSADFLRMDRVRDALCMLRGKFDVVLIDSPPCIGFADALIISDYADATIIVVSAAKGDRKEVQKMITNLKQAGGNVAGAIISQQAASQKKSNYYYYYSDKKESK